MRINKLFFIFILLLISCTSVMALPYIQLNGSVENEEGVFLQLTVPESTSGGSTFNGSANVTDCWSTSEGIKCNVSDITYDEISGGDVNALGYTGFFNYIQGVVGSLSIDGDPWWLAGTDLEIEENLIVSNVTANNINPEDTLTWSLGTGALRWLNLFVQNINAEEIDTFNLVASGNVTAEYFVGNITGSETDPIAIHDLSDSLSDSFTYVEGQTGYLNITTFDERYTTGGVKQFYFTGEEANATPTYYKAILTLPTDNITEIDVTAQDGETVIASFISDSAIDDFIVLEGTKMIHIDALVTNVVKITQLKTYVYLTNSTGGDKTLLRTSSLSIPLTVVRAGYIMSLYGPQVIINNTNRVLFEIVSVKEAGGVLPDVHLFVDDDTYSRVDVPVPAISVDLTSYAKLDGTNQPFTGDINLSDNSLIQTNFEMYNDGTNQIFDLTSGDFVFNSDIKAPSYIYSDTDAGFFADTTDGSDNKRIFFSGGGSASVNRGAYLISHGNEYTGNEGEAWISSGNVADTKISFRDKGTEYGLLQGGNWGFGTLSSAPQKTVHIKSSSYNSQFRLERDSQGYFDFTMTGGTLRFISDTGSTFDFTRAGNLLIAGDNRQIVQGAGNDYKQYFDGSNQQFTLTSGGFFFNAPILATDGTSTTRLTNAGGYGYFGTSSNHPFRIQTNGSSKLQLETNGDLKQFFDNQKIFQGASDDYSQYFDGSNQNFDLTSGNYVFNTGDVGIGTIPSNKLHIYGDVSDYLMVIDNDQSSSGNGLKISTDGGGAGTIPLQIENAVSTMFKVLADNSVHLPNDNGKFYQGAGNDYSQYFDGTDQRIDMLGGNYKFNNGVYKIELYDTTDQTTNYEKFMIGFDTASSVLKINALHDGTASANAIELGISATANGVANRILRIQSGMPFFSYNVGGTGLSGAAMIVGESSLGANDFRFLSSSSSQKALGIYPQIDQSGTASYTALHINVDEDTTGSGTNYLIDTAVNSDAKFQVKSDGTVMIPKDSISLTQGAGNDYSQYFDGVNQLFELVSGIFKFNKGVEITGNLNQTGGNSLLNGIYGEMSYHNYTGTTINFASASTYYPLFFTNNGFDNGVIFEGGYNQPSNLTLQYDGTYKVDLNVQGSGQNNHEYHAVLFANETEVEECEVVEKLAAGGDITPMMTSCIHEFSAGTVLTGRIADYTGTGNGIYYAGNLNVIRVGN